MMRYFPPKGMAASVRTAVSTLSAGLAPPAKIKANASTFIVPLPVRWPLRARYRQTQRTPPRSRLDE